MDICFVSEGFDEVGLYFYGYCENIGKDYYYLSAAFSFYPQECSFDTVELSAVYADACAFLYVELSGFVRS